MRSLDRQGARRGQQRFGRMLRTRQKERTQRATFSSWEYAFCCGKQDQPPKEPVSPCGDYGTGSLETKSQVELDISRTSRAEICIRHSLIGRLRDQRGQVWGRLTK